jgi:chitinase
VKEVEIEISGSTIPIDVQTKEKISEVLDADNAELFMGFIERMNSESSDKSEMYSFMSIASKEKRKELHEMIRNHFPMLETHSLTEEG